MKIEFGRENLLESGNLEDREEDVRIFSYG
jgi:hypothetical protein